MRNLTYGLTKRGAKRLRMSERCNDEMACFQAVRTKLPLSVIEAYNVFGRTQSKNVNQHENPP